MGTKKTTDMNIEKELRCDAEEEIAEVTIDEKLDSILMKIQLMEKSILRKSEAHGESETNRKQFVMKHVEWEEFHDMKWRLGLERSDAIFGFYIQCDPIAPTDKWLIETEIQFKMVGKNKNSYIKNWKENFKNKKGRRMLLLKRKEDEKVYVIDGNLSVEVTVCIIKTNKFGIEPNRLFDESQKDLSDVVLVVGDAKFFVLRKFLAGQSPVFKALLLGKFSESEMSEIPLAGIDPHDFQYYLEVLHGESAIDDSTVEGVLHISDMYETQSVTRKCEEFLLEKSKKSSEDMRELAAQYNLMTLKEKVHE